MAVIPQKYQAARRILGFNSVSLGYNGVELFPNDEIEAEQVGYSVSPSGESLCADSAGAWQQRWIVIGIETLCGDPLILDTLDANLRVLFAVHGQGQWEPRIIAPTLDGFFDSIRELKRLATGREGTVALEENPINDSEQSAFLQKIGQINGTDDDVIQFWESMLENET